MEITRNGTRPSADAPDAYFTGRVRQDPLSPGGPGRPAVLSVTFEPGARTAWHTHPHGQTLIVVSGLGRAQSAGGPVEDLHPGDIVWFGPGEKHWHGASPEVAMTHIAIQVPRDGTTADWMEKVSDAEYTRTTTA